MNPENEQKSDFKKMTLSRTERMLSKVGWGLVASWGVTFPDGLSHDMDGGWSIYAWSMR